jgi:nucleotide-binding universal stress UspA family protein
MKGYRKVLIALPYDGDLDLTGIKNLNDVLDDGGSQAVREIKKTAEAEGAMVKTRLEAGDVPQRIVEVAEEEKCDLIIMGSKKKKGILSRLFGDHVVEKVIDRAPCPVYVVAV